MCRNDFEVSSFEVSPLSLTSEPNLNVAKCHSAAVGVWMCQEEAALDEAGLNLISAVQVMRSMGWPWLPSMLHYSRFFLAECFRASLRVSYEWEIKTFSDLAIE